MLQYIGARYVPIFYVNSVDPSSSEWENNVTYEPMTWVSLPNGHMYISKKEVPTTVGTPASNPEYWLEAGQYNAYIQSLQDQINDMNDGTVSGSLQNQINEMNDGTVSGSLQNQITTNTNDISDMKDGSVNGSLQAQINTLDGKCDELLDMTNRVFILCGDSLGSGYTPGVMPTKGWSHWVMEMINAAGGKAYRISSYGAGFAVPGNTWLLGLQDQESAWESIADTVTDVVFLGGSNDTSSNGVSVSTLTNGIVDTFDYVREHYPNAKISVGILSAIFNKLCNDSAGTYNTYRDVTLENAGRFLGDLRLLATNPDYLVSDRTHLTQEGYHIISRYIFNCLLTGHVDFTLYTNAYDISFDGTTVVNTTPTGSVKYIIKPDVITAEYIDKNTNAPLCIELSDNQPQSSTIKDLFRQNYNLPTGSAMNILGDAQLFSVSKSDYSQVVYRGVAKILSWDLVNNENQIRVFYPIEVANSHRGEGTYKHYLAFNQFVFSVK